MTAYLLTLHLLNLVLPAAALAGLAVAVGGWLAGGRGVQPLVSRWRARFAWTWALNVLVLAGALGWFRADGRMATYGALVLVSALAQFVMWRGWRR